MPSAAARPRTPAVDFDVTPAERDAIARIVERAVRDSARHGVRIDPLSLTMDITATHRNGCPLRLDALLGADDFNFAHDVGGIMRHLDRSTGRLGDCFVPRFAAPSGRSA